MTNEQIFSLVIKNCKNIKPPKLPKYGWHKSLQLVRLKHLDGYSEEFVNVFTPSSEEMSNRLKYILSKAYKTLDLIYPPAQL